MCAKATHQWCLFSWGVQIFKTFEIANRIVLSYMIRSLIENLNIFRIVLKYFSSSILHVKHELEAKMR